MHLSEPGLKCRYALQFSFPFVLQIYCYIFTPKWTFPDCWIGWYFLQSLVRSSVLRMVFCLGVFAISDPSDIFMLLLSLKKILLLSISKYCVFHFLLHKNWLLLAFQRQHVYQADCSKDKLSSLCCTNSLLYINMDIYGAI